MNIGDALLLILSLAVCVYLGFALLRAERF
jgi:K+-transporting ATPase KdpF subunit